MTVMDFMTKEGSKMPEYLIESPHTKEDCLQALDELKDTDPRLLNETWFGCVGGDHTGYSTVAATSESEARSRLPGFLRSKARVVEVSKFTPQQIESFHK